MLAARLTIEQLPSYSPDFNPIEHLWKKVKKEATHLKYFPDFTQLQAEVERALLHFAQTPREITVLMARYGETLGTKAAYWRTKHFRKVYNAVPTRDSCRHSVHCVRTPRAAYMATCSTFAPPSPPWTTEKRDTLVKPTHPAQAPLARALAGEKSLLAAPNSLGN